MKQYAQSYNLDGFPANVCQIVCDIRHQGRASSQQIINALNTSGNFEKAYNQLLQLGQPLYASRISTVRGVIKSLNDAGLFGKRYKLSKGDFV
jgi:DNA-directed RNA polymerase specialized sigma54-like protein